MKRIYRTMLLGSAMVWPVVIATTSAQAATNIVTNGDFETGDLTGFTGNGDFATGYNRVDASGFRGVNPDYGSYLLLIGNYTNQGVAGVQQTLDTTPGQAYDFSVEWAEDGSNDADNHLFQVLWDNTPVITITNETADLTFQLLSATVVGTGSDMLTIQGFSNSGYNEIDNVSVVASDAVPGTVPEPATWAMMLTGFGLAGAGLRRRPRLIQAV